MDAWACGGRRFESRTSRAGVPLARINAVAGTLSSGGYLPARTIACEFASKEPGSVSLNGVARQTRGYAPLSFDALIQEDGSGIFGFSEDLDLWFSGGDHGSYTAAYDVLIENEPVRIVLSGSYSYVADGANQNRMTFELAYTSIETTSASMTFKGSVQKFAGLVDEDMPVSITFAAEYESAISGVVTFTTIYSSGKQESDSWAFDFESELDLSSS